MVPKTNYKQHQQEKVRDKRRQSKCINCIVKFEDIMINRYQNIYNYIWRTNVTLFNEQLFDLKYIFLKNNIIN